MDTNAESSMQNKVIEYVKQYAMITLSISIMSVGVYFFKFPNNFVFGGVTGMAALAAKLTPLSASAFSSAANMILLGVGLIFLGKKFAMTTGYATVVMSLELMALEKICPLRGPLSDQPMLDLLFAIAAPENGSLHVDMLARMMQMLMNEDFVEKLKAAKTPKEFLECIDAQELADMCDTIPYEIMLGFSPRVRRAWEG